MSLFKLAIAVSYILFFSLSFATVGIWVVDSLLKKNILLAIFWAVTGIFVFLVKSMSLIEQSKGE